MTTRTRDTAPPAPLAALELKGGGHAVLPDIHAAFGRGLTFQAWLRLADLSAAAPLFAFGERADLRAVSIVVAAGSGDLVVELVDRAGAARVLVAPAALVAGTWAHVSVVLGERSLARVVVDGRERVTGKLALPAAGPRSLGYLGRGLAGDATLRGQLADVRLWSRDLSNDELEASRLRRLSGEEPELVAYWPLDAAIDGRLVDLSGHGRSARPVSAAVVPAPDLPLRRTALPSPALALRGGATLVATSTLTRVAPGLTVQANVRLARFTAGARLLELADADARTALTVLTPRADGGLRVQLQQPGAGPTILDAGALPLDVWTHLTVAVDADELALYLDGQRVRAARLARPPKFAGHAWRSLTIGGGPTLPAFDADIAEVRLFTRRLGERQVARSVRRTMLGTEADLAILWRLNEARGLVARNAGLLGNDPAVPTDAACDGAIQGGTWIEHSGLVRARPSDARITRALSLGGGGHATIPGTRRGFADGYTLEAWVRPTRFNGATLVDLCDWRDPQGRPLDPDKAGLAFDRISLQLRGATPGLQFVASRGAADPGATDGLRILAAPDVLRPDRWHHVAVTVHPTGLVVLHVDGARVAERALFTPDEVAADASVVRRHGFLGRGAGPTPHLEGALAEVRLWARPLTTGELRDRRHLRADGSEHALVRAYPLDDLTTPALVDLAAHRDAGALVGGLVREQPDLPLWPSDERAGAGVDAICTLMQDPRVDTRRHVPVFEVRLSARRGDGRPAPGVELEVSVDEPVTLRHDLGDGVVLRAAPQRPVKLTTNMLGRARLTLDAGAFTVDGQPVLRCPLLRVRTPDMPAGQYDVILPDLQALEALATATGPSLQRGNPARPGRKATASPLGRPVSAADADELAGTVRALLGVAARAGVALDDDSPLAFAAGDEAPAAAPALASSPSAGAIARVDTDAPLRRTVPERRLPLPDDTEISFAAGDGPEILAAHIFGAPTFAAEDDDALPFAGETRLARTRRMRDQLDRLGQRVEAALDRIGDTVKELGANTLEFLRDIKDLLKSAPSRPAGEFFRDLGGAIEDAIVVAVKTVDPGGYVVEAIHVLVESGGKLIRTIVDSFEAAVVSIHAFFRRVGASIERVVGYLAALFDWDDILDTADELLAGYKDGLAKLGPAVKTLRGKWEQQLVGVEHTVTGALDRAIAALGVATPPKERAAAKPAESDARTGFIFDKLTSNLAKSPLAFDLPAFDPALLSRVKQALAVADIGEELKAGLASIDWDALLAEPRQLLAGGASALLLGLRSALQFVLRMIKALGALALEFVEQALAWLIRVMETRLKIPWLTEFIETTILRGRRLSLLTLLAVVTAIPATIATKLRRGVDTGADEAAPLAFGPSPREAKKQQLAEAQQRLTEIEEAAKRSTLAAYTSAVCNTIASLFSMLSDVTDEEAAMSRGFRILAAGCGVVALGVGGLPGGDTDAERGLAWAGFSVSLLNSVFALLDGAVVLVLALKDPDEGEKAAEVFGYVMAGVGAVVIVWEIANAISAAKLLEMDDKQRFIAGFTTASNLCGGLSQLSTLIPDSSLNLKLVQIAVNGTVIMLQLGFGLVAAVAQGNYDDALVQAQKDVVNALRG